MPYKMTNQIWVDADSCPRMVKEYLVTYSEKLQLPIFFVANRPITFQNHNPLLKMIVCSKESQAADDYITENVSKYDIVITRDIPFAERLVNKNIKVVNDRGTVFSTENIKERLSERDFSYNLNIIGLGGYKKNTYSKKEFGDFANCFDREIHRLISLLNQDMQA